MIKTGSQNDGDWYNLSNQTRELDALKSSSVSAVCMCTAPHNFSSLQSHFTLADLQALGPGYASALYRFGSRVKLARAIAESRSRAYACAGIFVTPVFAAKETIILLCALLQPRLGLSVCTFQVAFLGHP